MKIRFCFQYWALVFGLCVHFWPHDAFAQDMAFLGHDKSNPLIFSLDAGENGEVDEQKAGLNLPFYTDHETDRDSSFFGLVRAHRIGVKEQIVLRDRQYEVPTAFGSGDIGFGWAQADAKENKRGASINLGSSGRQILNDSNVKSVNATAFSERRRENGDSLIFLIAYSSNRTFLKHIPLPGFAYSVNAEKYKLVLGVPFVFWLWRPGKFMLNAFAVPYTVSMDASYFFHPPFQVFSSVAWAPKTIDNPGTGVEDEKLFYDKKEWTAGLRMYLSRQTSFTAAYTYAFDRKFYLGRSLFETTSDVEHVADAGGFVLKLKVGF